MQLTTSILVALAAAAPLVAAHGKVPVVQGDAGGNGTALGIQGGVVPGEGKNSVTEVDTTVFGSTKIQTDGLGKTTGGGRNTPAKINAAMALSGDTLPQVSPQDGSLSGIFHIVTTDGAGPLQAVVDPTGTGTFSAGKMAQVVQQVPGTRGNIAAPKQRSVWARALVGMGLMKRAKNVNEDFPFKIAVPAGTTCTGTMGGQTNVCLMKLANSNPAGPFGGVFPFQIAGQSGAGAPATNTSAATKAPPARRGRALARAPAPAPAQVPDETDPDDFEITPEPDT